MTQAARARGIGYSMLFPPGWREFRTDLASEQQVIELAAGGARAAGRADIALEVRRHVHRMFEGLRRRGAIGVHLPVTIGNDQVLPASLTVVPLRSRSDALPQAVADRSEGSHVDTIEVSGAIWHRWTDRSETLDGTEGAASVTVHYVIPRPDHGGALHLLYAFMTLTDDSDQEPARALEALGHGIIGTFAWGSPP